MLSRRQLLLLLSSVLLSVLAAAQTAARLVPTETSLFQSEWRRPIISPVRCDQDGYLYIREYAGPTNNNVVTIATPKGDITVTTSLDSNPDLKNGKLSDFGISPSGELFELVHLDGSVYIVNFKRDGSLAGAIRLEKKFWPAKLAVGTGGAFFLVSGTELPTPGKAPKVFDALFDASGRMVHEVTFSNDPAQMKDQPGAGSDKNYLEDKASVPLQLGTAEADVSGNFYVIRASEPPVAFVLNASGELVRRLEIKAPEPGMRLLAAHVNSGKVAALVGQTSPDGQILKKTMVITDTTNGETLQQYAVPPDLGSAFACYSGNDFAFITTKDKKLAIQHARPE